MDPEEKRKQLERGILKIIEQKLISGQMTPERAKEIARYILEALHPPLTLKQIYQLAPTLDDHYTELTAAVLPISAEYNDKMKEVVISHVKELMSDGKIAEALDILKKTNNNQINIKI